MRILGLTGGTGSGKTTALRVLSDLGALTIDCDEVYHDLTANSSDMKAEIESAFPGVVTEGRLDRKKLGEIVFSDSELLALLNRITHKYVSLAVEQRISSAGNEAIVAIDAIALIESGLAARCDYVIAVAAELPLRIQRIMKREAISEEYATLRAGAQKQQSWYEQNCNLVLVNNGTPEEFEELCRIEFTRLIHGS